MTRETSGTDDDAEATLRQQNERFPPPESIRRRSAAIDSFFGSPKVPDTQSSTAAPAPSLPKSSRKCRSPKEQDSAVIDLVTLLLHNRERVTLQFDGVTLQFSVFVHQDDTTLTLLGWGENRVQLQLHDMASQVIKITRESGQSCSVMYLGACVTLGLHGSLISFMLVEAPT